VPGNHPTRDLSKPYLLDLWFWISVTVVILAVGTAGRLLGVGK
jgi:hypothetical protein